MILIVEDEPLARRALQAILAASGYTSTAVSSGEEALEYLHRGAHPDTMLIDIDLPGMSGLELLDQVQREDPTLQCMLMSALEHDLGTSRSVPFLAKPLDLGRLLSLVRHYP
jgi:CheY-like chemotaxis protein